MKIEIRIREDLWKAIEAHYERNDFTEAVRDAVYTGVSRTPVGLFQRHILSGAFPG